jgi:hypothetical protein
MLITEIMKYIPLGIQVLESANFNLFESDRLPTFPLVRSRNSHTKFDTGNVRKLDCTSVCSFGSTCSMR